MKGFVFPGVRGEPVHQNPGVYQAVPFDEYLSWNAISNSSLGAAIVERSPKIVVSMGHYVSQKPMEESAEIRFGKLCHAGRFEFMTALKQYAVMPDLIAFDVDAEGNAVASQCTDADGKATQSKNAKMYKDRVARWTACHVGQSIVSQDEFNRMGGVLYALDQDEMAREYFRNNGPATDYELSIVWKDTETGLLCKGRIDCVQHDKSCPTVIDLKTTDSVIKFPRTAATFGYHRQAAYYSDGMHVLTGCMYTPAAVAVEREKPHTVHGAPWRFASEIAGRMEYRAALNAIATALDKNDWPSVSPPGEWAIPAYALPEMQIG